MCASYSFRKYRIVERTGFGAVFPNPQWEVSLICCPSRSSRPISSSFPLPAAIRFRILSITFIPIRQGTHLPQDSSTEKSVKNRAVSTMQVESFMTTRPPDPIMAPASSRESKSPSISKREVGRQAPEGPPLRRIGGTFARVSTLLRTVGWPHNPASVERGGLILGMPRFPSREYIRAVDSPHTQAPAPG